MKTLLVALLILVVGTGTASAECAWVLWLGIPGPPEALWTPMESYTKPEPCKAQAEFNRRIPGMEKGPGHFVCLPDTVDPRGPKGK